MIPFLLISNSLGPSLLSCGQDRFGFRCSQLQSAIATADSFDSGCHPAVNIINQAAQAMNILVPRCPSNMASYICYQLFEEKVIVFLG